MMLPILLVSALLLGQSTVATMEARRGDAQTRKQFTKANVAGRLREADPKLTADRANRDAEVLTQADKEGAFDRFKGDDNAKIEAAASVWAVLHPPPPPPATTGGNTADPITVKKIKSVAQSMGKVVVNSTPEGASITVDGHQWKRRTNAEGYAYEGMRRIRVSEGSTEVGVLCDVHRDGTVMATVDLQSRSSSCK